MAQFKQRTPDDAIGYWTDDWDGYPADRAQLFQHIADSRVRNPVVLSGDIHAFLVNDVVCVAMTPLVLDLCRRLKRPAIPGGTEILQWDFSPASARSS